MRENFMSGSMRGGWERIVARALATYAPVGNRRGTLVSPHCGTAPAAYSTTSQDEQLLAKDEEFEIAIGRWATSDDEQVNQQAEERTEQSQQHGHRA
ncbi:MAG TPA: hypothetical protein VHM88_03260 [Candidatus Acidoferrales bacterium]|nr:hypothetical protein [Candidatus Acidoferrales bacterium]